MRVTDTKALSEIVFEVAGYAAAPRVEVRVRELDGVAEA
jgi:uncharacterized protein YggE